MATILIVDDDPVIRRVLSAQLRKAGYTTVQAMSGEDALRQLAEFRPNLAIFDISMPVMDGLTLLRTLRARPDCATLPVIMLTGSGQEDDAMEAVTAGANAFLLKPTSTNELIDTVARLLG